VPLLGQAGDLALDLPSRPTCLIALNTFRHWVHDQSFCLIILGGQGWDRTAYHSSLWVLATPGVWRMRFHQRPRSPARPPG
jgi:hypothetical protein